MNASGNIAWAGWAWWVLGPVLAWACVWDLRSRRIPNALCVTGLALGLALQAALPAGSGLFHGSRPGSLGLTAAWTATALMAAAVGLLWRIRLFGAGDAKLLLALAPFFGPRGVAPLLVLTLISGGALALAAWGRGRLHRTGLAPLPYAWAIAGAALVLAALGGPMPPGETRAPTFAQRAIPPTPSP